MLDDLTKAQVLEKFHCNFFRGGNEDFSWWQAASWLILIIFAGTPPLEYAGFREISFWRELPMGLLLAISATASMVAFAIYYPEWRYWYVGLLPGLLAGPGIFLATYWYCLPREKVGKADLAWLLLGGALPAFAMYYFLLRWVVLRDAALENEMFPRRQADEFQAEGTPDAPSAREET